MAASGRSRVGGCDVTCIRSILNRGQMRRTKPELAPPFPNFRAAPAGGRLATTYDLACNRPHTRRIFVVIWFRGCGLLVETLPLGHRGLQYT
ncbi:hypothetical protein AVEN_115071-1 [Araneus ventricosus]|uniref:Uncharacterized protein n=1 Tax=Araneus ventricosus TaxID=182803 RepID=A0A4Y1ZXC6_ARAVE|nr:hypothetical protein AVEN_115071-1 [Araneus ventricosus]